MKWSNSILYLLSLLSAANAIVGPDGDSGKLQDLYKRRGGGGGGGRGGGSSGGSRSGSSGSSGGGASSPQGSDSSSQSTGSLWLPGSGSSGGVSGSSSSAGRGSATSNAGGITTFGSGVTPRFGGGRYFQGGATIPYRSGRRTPSGIVPVALLGGALIFWGAGLWLAGAYLYAYGKDYKFENISADPDITETLPVFCICQPNVVCGCDDIEDQTWLDDIIGDGNYLALNDSLVFVGEVNGTKGIYINGTLPNGTTAAIEEGNSNAAIYLPGMLGAVGFWPAVVAVGAAVLI